MKKLIDKNNNTPGHFNGVFQSYINNDDVIDRSQKIRNDYLIKDFKGGKLLDVGCGNSPICIDCLKKSNDIWGMDFSPNLLEYLRKKYPRINWIRADWRDGLPFRDNCFDYITAGEVIEHTENPREFLKELFRVLKKGGMIKLTTPYEEGYSRESCAPIEHIWGFRQEDIEKITGELGEHDVELIKDERDYIFLAAYIKK